MRRRDARAALARVPERPPTIARLRPQIDSARGVGVTVDELDRNHVLLTYDARDRDQWLALDELYDAARDHATIEGDWSFEASPNNWMVIHFDYGVCGVDPRARAAQDAEGPGPDDPAP